MTVTPWKLWDLAQDAAIELYEIDASAIGDTVYRFANNDMYGSPIVWNAQTYSPFPIQVVGFEKKTQGALPRPQLTVANVGGIVSALCMATGDLIGAKVTRIRTFRGYLDAVNFPGGVNPTANPNVELPREIWRVDRRSTELRETVSFDLAAPWDVVGVRLPRRIVVQHTCMWVYRSSECGYAGGPVADSLDIATANPLLDVCGKRPSSCKLRFGDTAELPFGGFPGVGQTTNHS